MPNSVDFNALASRVRRGDDGAFDALYLAGCQSVFFHADKLLGPGEAAEDAVTEAFVCAWKELHEDGPLPDPRSLDRRACRTALSKIRDRRYRDGLSIDGGAAFEEPVAQYEGSSAVDTARLAQLVSEMVDKLDISQRAALILYYYDSFSIAEIARMMGCSEDTVKSRLGYARSHMLDALLDQDGSIRPAALDRALIARAVGLLVERYSPSAAAVLSVRRSLAQVCGYPADLPETAEADGASVPDTQAEVSSGRVFWDLGEDAVFRAEEQESRGFGAFIADHVRVIAFVLAALLLVGAGLVYWSLQPAEAPAAVAERTVPGAPEIARTGWDSITIYTRQGLLYRLDNGPWIDPDGASRYTFSGLSEETDYTLYACLANAPDKISAPRYVTTEAITGPRYAIDLEGGTAYSLSGKPLREAPEGKSLLLIEDAAAVPDGHVFYAWLNQSTGELEGHGLSEYALTMPASAISYRAVYAKDIRYVELQLAKTPAVGAKIALSSSSITLGGDLAEASGVRLERYQWYDSIDGVSFAEYNDFPLFGADRIFRLRLTYIININPANPYRFGEEIEAMINGVPAAVERISDTECCFIVEFSRLPSIEETYGGQGIPASAGAQPTGGETGGGTGGETGGGTGGETGGGTGGETGGGTGGEGGGGTGGEGGGGTGGEGGGEGPVIIDPPDTPSGEE